MKIEKAREVCAMYHNGVSVTAISKHYGNTHGTIRNMLKRWYKTFYNEEFIQHNTLLAQRAEEIYNQFKQIYAPFSYSRKELCNMIDCTATELDYTIRKYDLSHLRLQTYENQVTLCNVPKEIHEEYKAYADEHNISIRKLACMAINNYILNDYLKDYNQEG